jgi:hypothetical protein
LLRCHGVIPFGLSPQAQTALLPAGEGSTAADHRFFSARGKSKLRTLRSLFSSIRRLESKTAFGSAQATTGRWKTKSVALLVRTIHRTQRVPGECNPPLSLPGNHDVSAITAARRCTLRNIRSSS